MRAVILVPRRADPHRDRLWQCSRGYWLQCRLDIYTGEHEGPGPFSRARAINRAASAAGDWDVAVAADGDVIADPDAVHTAIRFAHDTGGLVTAFDRRGMLRQRATRRILNGDTDFDWRSQVRRWQLDNLSTALAVRRDLWEELHGYDERFRGWGWEDIAFKHAATCLTGLELERVTADVFHLWHPPAAGNDWSRYSREQWSPEFRDAADLAHLYFRARRDESAMLRLLRGRLSA